MANPFNKITVVNGLLGLSLVLYVLSVWSVNARQDDEFLGEPVYWLVKTGVPKSNLMYGWKGIGWERYQSVFHKLLVYNGCVAVRLLGWSAVSLHLVSLTYFGVFWLVMVTYYRARSGYQPLHLATFALLAMVNARLAYFSFTFRPEVMLMALGFASYVFLEKHWQTNRWPPVLAAGALAGLAFFTHLNGLIFCVVGAGLLASRGRWRAAMAFGVSAMLAFSPYFADVLWHADLAYFWRQFRNDPALRPTDFTAWEPLLRLSREHLRFFHGPREASVSVLLLASLGLYYRRLRAADPGLVAYFLTLVVALSLLTYSSIATYMLLYLPFMLVLTERAFGYAHTDGGYRSLAFTGLVVTYLAIQGYWQVRQVRENLTEPVEARAYAAVGAYLPASGARMVVPAHYLFDEIEKPNELLTIERFSWFPLHHGQPRPTFDALLHQLRALRVNYLVLDAASEKDFALTPPDYQRPGVRLVKNATPFKIIKLD